MATTKTLAPTNQTITIAAFQGEKPDQRQIADAEGKLADAVNALNSQKLNKIATAFTASTTGTTVFNIGSGARFLVAVVDSTMARCGLYIVVANAAGDVSVVDIKTASGISFSTDTNKLTLTSASGSSPRVLFLTAYDNLPASQHVSM